MILSQSFTQPYALLVFSLLGLIFGIIYMLNWFLCAFLIKSRLYRHISQCVYVLCYGISFFLCALIKFEYNLHVYFFAISVCATALISALIYIPVRNHRKNITEKCSNFRNKIAKSKFAQRIKK